MNIYKVRTLQDTDSSTNQIPIFTVQPNVTGGGEFTAMIPLTCDGDGCGKEEGVVWYCKNCPCSLCESCKLVHEASRMTGNHRIVPRTSEAVRLHKFTKNREQCKIHDREEITMFCHECQVPCCTLCIESHQRHTFSQIEKVLSQTTRELAEKLAEMEELAAKMLVSDKREVSIILGYYKEMMDKAITDAKTEKDIIISKLNEIYDEKLRDIEEKYTKDKVIIESDVHSRSEIRQRKLQHCRGILQQGGLDMIGLNTCLTKQTFFADTKAKSFSYPVFRRTLSLESKLDDLQFGQVEYVSTLRMDISVVTQLELDNLCTSLKLSNKGNTVEGCIESGGFLVVDKDQFKIKKTIACSKECLDFVRNENDEILFCDGECVWKLLPDGNVTLHIKEDYFYAQGLCINNKGQIVVCMDQATTDSSHLSVYSADGQKKLMEISHEINGTNILDHSQYVIQNGGDYCVINLSGTAVAFDMKGSYRWTYGAILPPECKLPSTLRCISNDALYNIFIADGINRCIYCLNKDGNFLYLISREQSGIYSPIKAMVVDSERQQIWTVDSNRKLTVLGYKPVETEDSA